MQHIAVMILIGTTWAMSVVAQSAETPEALKARVKAWAAGAADIQFIGLIEYDEIAHWPAEPFRANHIDNIKANIVRAEQHYRRQMAGLANTGRDQERELMLRMTRMHERTIANLKHQERHLKQWAEKGMATGSLRRVYLGEGGAARTEISWRHVDPPNPLQYQFVMILAVALDGDSGWRWQGSVGEDAESGSGSDVKPLSSAENYDQFVRDLNQSVDSAERLLNPKKSYLQTIDIKSVESDGKRILVRFGHSGDEEWELTYDALMELVEHDGGFRVMRVEVTYTKDGTVHENMSTFKDYRRVDKWDVPFFQEFEQCEQPAGGGPGKPNMHRRTRKILRIRPGLSEAERKCFSPPDNAFDVDKKGESPRFKYEDLSPPGVEPLYAKAEAEE